ncbi:hypothetical protein CELL_03205 [Cellulomonas sp. T2.31MG-18]|uniref:AAA family ATPase n=1 Tax=Cellulomonas sp. T2.31MG-18 TaxID=3157619 RepID=UPI0035E92597
MTIENDIRNWALLRPAWQQDVLVALSRGETYDDAGRIAALADRLLTPGSDTQSASATGISLGTAEHEQVRLKGICNVTGVNALACDQTLTFASHGLTVVYGNNGSGKSGYARIIKAMVSARHSSPVLPDVYADRAPDPSAELEYKVGDEDRSEKYPVDPPVPDLQKVRFYDEHCGDEYLTRESSVTYRPSALVLLDGLVAVCDKVRNELQRRVSESDQGRLTVTLPEGTPASTFFAALSAQTTSDEIDEASKFSAEDRKSLGAATLEVARLETSDATKEKARLNADASQLRQLVATLAQLEVAVDDDRFRATEQIRDEAATKRGAATLAASAAFDDAPLPGVGSETWRTLWVAARAYAATIPTHEHELPLGGDGVVCVLCQQPLDQRARDRFEQFAAYMKDTTEHDAQTAERAYADALAALRELEFTTPGTSAALATLRNYDEGTADAVLARLGTLEGRRDRALAAFTTYDGTYVGPLAPSTLGTTLAALATSVATQAAETDVDGFRSALLAARKTRDQLDGAQRLNAAAEELRREVSRRQHIDELNAARQRTDTATITRKSSELTSRYATDQIRDNFTRETERMRLQRVTLRSLGGQKGQVRQIPALLGARTSAKARDVLSEGEQTALGLAGFFTEAEFDQSRSAIVFDDPVTSLDHVRRDQVALRLAQLAKARQVIVFTHDIAFVSGLFVAASRVDVTLSARTIHHRGETPGYCDDGFPWKAQDTPTRLDTIEMAIQNLKTDRTTLDDDQYEARVSDIGGKLSETWERAVTSEIVNRVYDRGTNQVRPQMVRMLAKITPEDNKEYQNGYGRTSKWALRHDKSEEVNYVAPEPDELQAECALLKAWYKRIKSYQQ